MSENKMNLDASTTQAFCQSIALWCTIVAAIFGLVAGVAKYGDYHFGKIVKQQEKALSEQRILEQKKSDAAISEKIKNIENELAKLQKDPDKEKELTSEFPAGHQLFGVIDKQIVPSAKPSEGEIKIDWATAKILSVTKDSIEIMLPDTVFPGNNIFQGNITIVENKEGVTSSGYSIWGWSIFIKVLKSDENRVIAAIGYVRRPD